MSVALTFDDGPNNTTTVELLKLLEANQITVTFFVLGEMVKRNPSVLKQIADSTLGHEIGNHSWNHPNLKTKTDAEVEKQVLDTQKIIEETVGGKRASKIMRPPYGAASMKQRELIKKLGFQLVGWHVDPNDWDKSKSASDVSDHIIQKTSDNKVVLAHIHKRTVDAMKTVLPALKKKNFTMETVSKAGLFNTGGFS